MTDYEKEYQKKLHTLKVNLEKVPLEVLETKYATAYRKLRDELLEMTDRIVSSSVLSGILIRKEDADRWIPEIQNAISQSIYPRLIRKSVLEEQDYEKIMDYTFDLKSLVYSRYMDLVHADYGDTGFLEAS